MTDTLAARQARTVAFVLATLAYSGVLLLSYRQRVSPLFAYEGLTYRTPDPTYLSVAVGLVTVTAAVLPRRLSRPKAVYGRRERVESDAMPGGDGRDREDDIWDWPLMPFFLCAGIGVALQWLWNPETPAWGPIEVTSFVVGGVWTVIHCLRHWGEWF